MNELHEQFVIEARELIAQATDDLIALERDGASAERIDRVFRAFHTLKGSAGVVNLPTMSLALHAAEDLLAAVKAGRPGVTPAIIDQALACLDQVANWVDAFESVGALPAEAGEAARGLAERLRRLLTDPDGAVDPAPTAAAPPAATDSAAALPDWVAGLLELEREAITQKLRDHPGPLQAIDYQPLPGCFFNGDDPVGLMRKVPGLLALQIEQREPWPALDELDPYACNLTLRALAAADRAELATLFRLLPDQVKIIELPTRALQPAPEPSSPDLVEAVLAEQIEVLRAGRPEDLIGRIGAVARVAANVLRHDGRPELAEQALQAGTEAAAQTDVAPLRALLDRLLSPEPESTPEPPTGPDTSASRSLRVDESRIDALVNLAGELGVMQNGFAHLARRLDAEIGDAELARAMRREAEGLDRLAAELRGAILQLRMVPVAQVFRSFPRLVRDMARRLGKSVTLVTRGETTESDKTIVDLLFEPLLHLVRNALDHGIETPDQRRAAGKPEAATLTLQASRASDRFVVEVSDDGRGIDPALVRQRAVAKGLLGAEAAAALSDAQALDLIFAAGFSTATELSEISGRGVGMDVVRSTIEGIGGRIALTSQVGLGTSVSLDLPLSIAMLRIMVVEAGGQSFGIPMDAVAKTVRLTPDQISRIKTNDGFVLDDRVVPICPLAELLNLPHGANAESNVRLVVVAELGGQWAGLEVDAIRDRIEVVLKPMAGVLAHTSGYAGTTLLGDGSVLLVLDLKEIMP